MKKKIFYIYEVKGIKNGCTTQWDIRSEQNFKRYNITPVIVETYEYPNTAEYWQIVGDREWELAELNGYPKGVHYRVAREKKLAGSKISGKNRVESGEIERMRLLAISSKLRVVNITKFNKLKRKLTYEDAQIIRELYSKKQYNQPQLAVQA
jgi:hypothetical protein